MSLPLGLLPRKHLLELSHSLTITLSFLHGCPQRPDCQGCGGRGPGADVPQGALQPRGMLCRPTASQVTLLPHAAHAVPAASLSPPPCPPRSGSVCIRTTRRSCGSPRPSPRWRRPPRSCDCACRGQRRWHRHCPRHAPWPWSVSGGGPGEEGAEAVAQALSKARALATVSVRGGRREGRSALKMSGGTVCSRTPEEGGLI